MINKNSKYWKEAKTHDKLRQQKGCKPMSESDLILTALHFERCDNEAMGAIAFDKKRQMGEKVSSADQTWRQEPVPSEEDVRAEIGEDEAADKRDANKQEEDFYNDFHKTGGGGERQ